jgi:hypothetical protein
MTPKSLNLATEPGEYWKVVDDKYVFNERQFNSTLLVSKEKSLAPISIKCMNKKKK